MLIVERFTAIVLIVFGAGFYSFMIGSISTILSNLDTRRAHLENKITIMDEFCTDAKIQQKLKILLRKTLTYISIKIIFSQEQKNQFLSEMSTDIKYQVCFEFSLSYRSRPACIKGLQSKCHFLKTKTRS